MAIQIVARLKDTGTLYASEFGIGFDEHSQNHISISPAGIYSAGVDEVTGTVIGKAMQQLTNGVLRVSGVFDEVTGIA